MPHFDTDQIANLRVEYTLKKFDLKDIHTDPITQFEIWFQEALNANVNEPNAMTLATVKPNGTPSARIVLLKGIQDRGFTFFTNYDSSKGLEIADNNHVALVFCWLELQRQVRIEGVATTLGEKESDAYFISRPRNSQIGAYASDQSKPIENRAVLERNFEHFESQFEHTDIVRPRNWGGYLIQPTLVEFWQGRASRLHDRFRYTLSNEEWKIVRLAP